MRIEADSQAFDVLAEGGQARQRLHQTHAGQTGRVELVRGAAHVGHRRTQGLAGESEEDGGVVGRIGGGQALDEHLGHGY